MVGPDTSRRRFSRLCVVFGTSVTLGCVGGREDDPEETGDHKEIEEDGEKEPENDDSPEEVLETDDASEAEEEESEAEEKHDEPSTTVVVGYDEEPVFEPKVVEIDPGDSVEFVWEDDDHTLTVETQPEEASWEGVPKAERSGYTYTHSFDVEGYYQYVSETRSGMRGDVIVGDVDLVEEVDPTFVLEATENGWVGIEPARVREAENPSLTFMSGDSNRVVWTNADGGPHRLVFEYSDGEIAGESSESTEEGQQRIVAVEGRAEQYGEYYCENHPETMQGDFGFDPGRDFTHGSTFADQESDGTSVTVDSLSGAFTGVYVAIYRDGELFEGLGQRERTEQWDQHDMEERRLGVSDHFPEGTHQDVEVPLDDELETGEHTLAAITHPSSEEGEMLDPYDYLHGVASVSIAVVTVVG